MMNRLTNLLSNEDHELYEHIYVKLGIKPHFHAFRWLTLLLSQEFPLPGERYAEYCIDKEISMCSSHNCQKP